MMLSKLPQTSQAWFQIVFALSLVLLSATAPVLAQTETDTGPAYEPCLSYGPPAPDQDERVIPDTPYLIVETRDLAQPNSTYGFKVYRVESTTDPNNPTRKVDVTDRATVTSTNISVVKINNTGEELYTVPDRNISTWVRLDASTSNNTGCANLMVANPEIENLEIVPGIWRFVSVLLDPTLFALLIAVFLAVATTRFTSAFGGLAIGQITLTVGWLANYVAWEMAVASLFSVLFIGMNLAMNVDYQTGTLRR